MKFNICDPATGAQKCFEIDDDKKCAFLFDRKMGAEVDSSTLGDEFKGYIFKIMGGNDKQGFPMKQGVLVKGRVRLLLKAGQSTYQPKRKGERKRKSVRGCIVGQDIRAISLALVKAGEKEIEGFSGVQHPRRVGPKRVTRIRKLFALTETRKDDKNGALVKKNVIRRTWTAASGKTRQKAPKIQRLSTPERRRRRRLIKLAKKQLYTNSTKASQEYHTLLQELAKQNKAAAQARKQSRSSAEVKEVKKEDLKKAPVVAKKDAKKDDKKAPVAAKVAAKKDDKKAPVAKKDDKKAPVKDEKKKAKK